MLFHGDAEWLAKSHAVTSRCVEFSAFLHGIGGIAGKLTAKIAYHPSCHLSRGLGVKTEPIDALKRIDGVEVVPFAEPEECCGFGGMFSVKHPEISTSMMERKLACIAKAPVERLVSCDMGCLLHLGGGLRRKGSTLRVQHLAQIVDEAAGPV